MRIARILGLLLLLAVGLAPTEAQADLKSTYTLVGTVTDAMNRPVAGELVVVDTNGPWARTDAAGNYSIRCDCYGDTHTVALQRLEGYKVISFTTPGTYRLDFLRARFKLWVTPRQGMYPVVVSALPGSVTIKASVGTLAPGSCVWGKDLTTGAIHDLTPYATRPSYTDYSGVVEIPVGTPGAPHVLKVAGYDCATGTQLTWDLDSQVRAPFFVDLSAPALAVTAPAPVTSNTLNRSVTTGGKAVLRTAADITDDAGLVAVDFDLSLNGGTPERCKKFAMGTSDHVFCDWWAAPGSYTLTTTVRDVAGRTSTTVKQFNTLTS